MSDLWVNRLLDDPMNSELVRVKGKKWFDVGPIEMKRKNKIDFLTLLYMKTKYVYKKDWRRSVLLAPNMHELTAI